jgi:hypothetical protein
MTPNHPLQRTRRKRRAAERERWAPEGNSRTQPVGAIGSGRRIMAT